MGIRQQANGQHNGSGAFTVALPAASLPGNLVVVAIAGNTVVNTPSGWTLRTSQVNYMGHYLWDRPGGATSWSFSANGQLIWWVAEVDGGGYINALSQNNTANAWDYATPALTPTAGDRLLLASIGSTVTGVARTVTAWSDSFTEQVDSCVPAADCPLHGGASREVTANGATAYSTTATFSSNSVGRTALIGAYATTTGGSDTPATFTGTAGQAAATGGTVTLRAAARLTAATGQASADGAGVALRATARAVGDSGAATAAAGTVALTGAASITGQAGTADAGGGTAGLTGGAPTALTTQPGTAEASGAGAVLHGSGTFTTTAAAGTAGGGAAALRVPVTLSTTPGAAGAAGPAVTLAAAARFTATTGQATATGGSITTGGGHPGLLFTQPGHAQASGLVDLTGAALFTGTPGTGDAGGGTATIATGTGGALGTSPGPADAGGGTVTLTAPARLALSAGEASAAGGTILWTRPVPHPARTLTIARENRTLTIARENRTLAIAAENRTWEITP